MEKLITFYSDTHIDIYEKHFLETYEEVMSDKYKLISKKINQVSPTGEYNSKGFDLAMMEKVDLIIENIDPNDNDIIIYSDCDVVFFKKIEFEMYDKDILFQTNYYEGAPCAGFFVARQSDKLLNFFKFFREEYRKMMNGQIDDQGALEIVLKREHVPINFGFLTPTQSYNTAFSTKGTLWKGQTIEIPVGISNFHANWTVGTKNKMNLLEIARNSQKK